MGAFASKTSAATGANVARRTLPRAGATPIKPYVEPESLVSAPREFSPVEVKDVRLTEMMSSLTVDTADVSAVDYGYAPSPSSVVKRREQPPREALLRPLQLMDALERHRASGFAASALEEIARARPSVCQTTLASTLRHLRAHEFKQVEDTRRPGETVRVGGW